MAKGGSKIVRRSAISGQFVNKATVKANPRTTETEHRPSKSPSKPPKRK
jgi:hypothetical protein